MDVHRDRRSGEPHRQGQGGDLGADAPEAHQRLGRVGHRPAELGHDPPGDREEVAGLGLGERGPLEEPDQGRLVQRGHRPRGSGRPRRASEADGHGRLVAGPRRDQAADELLERRGVSPVAEVEHRRLGQAGHGHPEAPEGLVDVERFEHGSGCFRRGGAVRPGGFPARSMPDRRRGRLSGPRRRPYDKRDRSARPTDPLIGATTPMRTLRLIAAASSFCLASALARGAEGPPGVVAAWAAGPMEVHLALDRPADPAWPAALVGRAIGFGEGEAAGGPKGRPGGDRGTLRVASARLFDDGRTLVLATDPHPREATYRLDLGGRAVSYTLGGVEASWAEALDADARSKPAWAGWWPELDPAASRAALGASAEAEGLWPLLGRPGRLTLRTLVALPAGPATLRLEADSPFEATFGQDAAASAPTATGGQRATLKAESTGDAVELSLTLRTGEPNPRIAAIATTASTGPDGEAPGPGSIRPPLGPAQPPPRPFDPPARRPGPGGRPGPGARGFPRRPGQVRHLPPGPGPGRRGRPRPDRPGRVRPGLGVPEHRRARRLDPPRLRVLDRRPARTAGSPWAWSGSKGPTPSRSATSTPSSRPSPAPRSRRSAPAPPRSCPSACSGCIGEDRTRDLLAFLTDPTPPPTPAPAPASPASPRPAATAGRP